MRKAIIISGYLNHLSDNILPFLDKDTEVYCHTWSDNDNSRWASKLGRYNRNCKKVNVLIEQPKFDIKRHSYFYSTYKVVNMIKDIDSYDRIIKFKPNVEGQIKYKGDIDHYFLKAYLQSRPLLNELTREDCIYGTVHYRTLDERMFSGYPLAFKKMFHILEEDFVSEMLQVDKFVKVKYGEDCEGSLFWEEWANRKQVPLIQDLDLKIPNSIPYGK